MKFNNKIHFYWLYHLIIKRALYSIYHITEITIQLNGSLHIYADIASTPFVNGATNVHSREYCSARPWNCTTCGEVLEARHGCSRLRWSASWGAWCLVHYDLFSGVYSSTDLVISGMLILLSYFVFLHKWDSLVKTFEESKKIL